MSVVVSDVCVCLCVCVCVFSVCKFYFDVLGCAYEFMLSSVYVYGR